MLKGLLHFFFGFYLKEKKYIKDILMGCHALFLEKK